MEVRDGFIVSVFNYCDQWCEVCPLTSHCRLFADLARADAACDSNMVPVFAEAPPPPQVTIAPSWLARLIGGAPRIDEDFADAPAPREPRLSSEHKSISERALAYAIWVREWLQDHLAGHTTSAAPADPVSIISWYASLNAAKIQRALTGLAEFDGDRESPPDHEGSAKVALIGLDRSLDAWRQLASEQRVAESVARSCIDELSWIKARLEAAIPCARAFMRPGFDEPEALQTLLALERA